MKDFHFHDCCEIYYALSDNIKYFVGDCVYDIHKGDVFVFNNMELHKTLVPENALYERYIVLFNPSYISSFSTDCTDLLECFLNRNSSFSHVVGLSIEQQATLLSLLKKGEYYCNNPVYGQEVYKKIALCEILLFVNNLYRTAGMLNPPKTELKDARIKTLIRWIHDNLNGDLSLDNLAARLYINKYHLGCLFKKATGFTINEYVINCRIMKARELLKENIPVSQVGEMVGYYNVSHFIRTFKKHTGVSPKQYAKR
jgi:AraC-like DNA-binding protein